MALILGTSAASAGAQTPSGPAPTSVHFIQYGVAIVGEATVSGGDVCPADATAPCIIGSGGGLAIRIGYRAREPWFVAGAYEFSRQDAANLLRLAILQQVRADARYYFDHGDRLTPYLAGSLGAAFYGNEFSSQTGGVTAFFGGGVEYQLSEATVIGAAAGYRPFMFRGWTDTTGQRRADRYLGFGFAHFAALELILEVRDALGRW